jgi:hypothetical protein
MARYNVIQDNNDEQVGSLANELMNSNLPTRQLNQVQALMNIHENLQPTLQAMTHANPLIERINSHSEADRDTICDSVDSVRSLGRICMCLQEESLSQEAVEIVNTEGQNVVTNLLNIYSRTTRQLQQNTLVLQEAITENERTTNDSVINDLLQQQVQITTNISNDPRQANQQIREAVTISSQLQDRIERLEPNVNATVRTVAQHNSQYLKHAVGIFFLSAAAVAMCAGIAYLTPVIISAFAAGGEAIAIVPVVLAVARTKLS